MRPGRRTYKLTRGEQAVHLLVCRSRVWESNPRPTHYEGRPPPPLPSLPATSLQHGSLGDAAAASLDASSRHKPCHDDVSDEGAGTGWGRHAMLGVILLGSGDGNTCAYLLLTRRDRNRCLTRWPMCSATGTSAGLFTGRVLRDNPRRDGGSTSRKMHLIGGDPAGRSACGMRSTPAPAGCSMKDVLASQAEGRAAISRASPLRGRSGRGA